jgi:hypothetical protein
MSKKGIVSLIFVGVLVVQILIFVSLDTPQKRGKIKLSTGAEMTSPYNVTDYEAQKNRNMTFGLIIGATVIAGGIVIFSMKEGDHPMEKENQTSD